MKYPLIIQMIAAITIFCAASSCRSTKQTPGVMSVTSTETVALGSNGDGSVIVRAWGSGKNQGDAIEQAMRNAVHDIIFTGIKKGTDPGAAAKALVPEVNAEERYSNYFEPFFSKGGEYRKFVSEEGGNAQRLQSKGQSRQAYGVVLIIDRSALRRQLVADGVLAK